MGGQALVCKRCLCAATVPPNQKGCIRKLTTSCQVHEWQELGNKLLFRQKHLGTSLDASARPRLSPSVDTVPGRIRALSLILRLGSATAARRLVSLERCQIKLFGILNCAMDPIVTGIEIASVLGRIETDRFQGRPGELH